MIALTVRRCRGVAGEHMVSCFLHAFLIFSNIIRNHSPNFASHRPNRSALFYAGGHHSQRHGGETASNSERNLGGQSKKVSLHACNFCFSFETHSPLTKPASRIPHQLQVSPIEEGVVRMSGDSTGWNDLGAEVRLRASNWVSRC